MAKITKEDLSKKLTELVASAGDLKDPSNQWKWLMSHFQYCLANYENLTPEAQQLVDGFQEQVLNYMETQLPAMPDSILARQLRRSLKGAKGKRLFAQGYIKVLESPVDSPNVLQKRSREIFEKRLQVIMDFVQDISEHKGSGPANFCKYALVSVCIDELLVAFHLLQKAYAAQTFSHLRTVQEALDLIALFYKEPKWADLWISDKPFKDVWAELKPGKVRAKLGKDHIFGKIYSLFSAQGSHPSFEMLRARCRSKVNPKGERPLISISIGGTPWSKEVIFGHVFLILLTCILLWETVLNFEDRLNKEEAKQEVIEAFKDFSDLFIETLIKPLQSRGRDLKEMEQSIRKMTEEISKIFDITT